MSSIARIARAQESLDDYTTRAGRRTRSTLSGSRHSVARGLSPGSPGHAGLLVPCHTRSWLASLVLDSTWKWSTSPDTHTCRSSDCAARRDPLREWRQDVGIFDRRARPVALGEFVPGCPKNLITPHVATPFSASHCLQSSTSRPKIPPRKVVGPLQAWAARVGQGREVGQDRGRVAGRHDSPVRGRGSMPGESFARSLVRIKGATKN